MQYGNYHVTKPFMSGRSQAVRIPREYHIQEEEVYINKVGSSIIITPKSELKATFLEGCAMLTEDFLEDGRPEEIPNERITL